MSMICPNCSQHRQLSASYDALESQLASHTDVESEVASLRSELAALKSTMPAPSHGEAPDDYYQLMMANFNEENYETMISECIDKDAEIASLREKVERMERMIRAAETYAEEIQEDCDCVNQEALRNFHSAIEAYAALSQAEPENGECGKCGGERPGTCPNPEHRFPSAPKDSKEDAR